VVNGYGIAPAAERAAFIAPASTEPSGKKCYYVLDDTRAGAPEFGTLARIAIENGTPRAIVPHVLGT
jgi:hypothetical protein